MQANPRGNADAKLYSGYFRHATLNSHSRLEKPVPCVGAMLRYECGSHLFEIKLILKEIPMQIFQYVTRLAIAASTLVLCLHAYADAPKPKGAVRAADAPTAVAAPALVKPTKKSLEDGMKAYDEDRFDEAYRLLRPHADSGNAAASFMVARMLDDGEGAQQDKANAMRFYRFAAERDDAYAQNNLAVMLRDGEAGARDFVQAWIWFNKAAALGNSEAMVSIGVMLEKGRGVEKNEAAANEWFRKSAEKENVKGAYNLGYNLRYGIGAKKNEAEARKWFRFAAERGDTGAKEALAR
jgi:hypothetical protein